MKRNNYILSLIVLLYCFTVKSQNYYLSDANFIAALKTSMPQVLKNDSLIISEAKKINGYLNLSSKSIVNVDGIQYFSNISQLDLSHNQITVLPVIEHFQNITNVSVFNNKLTELPKMPSKIKYIYAFDNQLVSISKLEKLDSLEFLHVSNNQLTEIPNLSNFPKLTKLHCNLNQISELKGLEKLTKIVDVYAWSNQLTSLDSLSNNSTLARLIVYNNNLTSLPNLKNKASLYKVEINNNYLTFEDLSKVLKGTSSDSIFSYNSMKSFVNGSILNSYHDKNVTLESKIDRNLSNIKYDLYLNDSTLIGTNYTGSFEINANIYSENDKFSLKISSNVGSKLTLKEKTWTIKKIDCNLLLPQYISILDNHCINGAKIKLLNVPFDQSYGYSFNSLSTDLSYSMNESFTLSNIPQGNYELHITSSYKCDVKKSFIVPNSSNCEDIFSPNNDGIKDTYYFDRAGEIKIYNTKGNLIQSFEGPTAWDGKDKNGNIVPLGYYTVIFSNAQILHLTVMK